MTKLSEIIPIHFEFSPRLGVREKPEVNGNYESNVKGLYVAGDLADAPIIKAALNQGYRVAKNMIESLKEEKPNDTSDKTIDILIVGAGPAGIGAGIACKDANLNYLILEKENPFQTIQNYPKHKIIFSETSSIKNESNFWFEDAERQDLIERWNQELDQKGLALLQPVEVTEIAKSEGYFEIVAKHKEDQKDLKYRARRVLLAIGRRGNVRKLGVPGEDLEKVFYALYDPSKHYGQKVLVVGGGDSAIEAACALAEKGAHVSLSYRQGKFYRVKKVNLMKINHLVEQGLIRIFFESYVQEIKEKEVSLVKGKERKNITIENDEIIVLIGAELPRAFFKKIGLHMAGDLTLKRACWVFSFMLMTYLFYVVKAGKGFWPFGTGDLLEFFPKTLNIDLGFRQSNPSFWGTVVYSLLITVFGFKAYLKYQSKEQKRKYISLITFQLVFLFGIPEIIAPFLIEKPWKMYAVSVPWPLSIWSLAHWPGEGIWILVGALVTFVGIPLYVRYQGERFCSYLCGCGGLAETVGDFWRHLAPRGRTAEKMHSIGLIILILAIPVTLLILNDAWRLFKPDRFYSAKNFAQNWYSLMVDFWFACVLGVACYPYLGNRVWCRFLCPLRAYMQLLSKWFGRLRIVSNEKCIGCGECTTNCQMGIDVQKFAQLREPFANHNSECIHCGICIEVCPMDVLSLERTSQSTRTTI